MKNKLEIRYKELTEILLERLHKDGYWEGKLSSSALGVAVAVTALHFYNAEENRHEIIKGLNWLKNNINSDGSYGDTPESPGNSSTSLLVYSAFNLYSIENKGYKNAQSKIAKYLLSNSIDIKSNQVSQSILNHYKKDYTFSVPILTMCSLCGVLGKDGFKNIPQLPFELALMPPKFYRLLNLGVVSYAVPALIAVGILIFKKKKQNKLLHIIRKKSIKRALKILEKTMPSSGGFLEAIPLTAFVSLSLINSGIKNNEIVIKGIDFLKRSQREDGSWPIDINLSTWVTSLGIKSLRTNVKNVLPISSQQKIANHLLSVQNKSFHPFNDTPPGGWGWSQHPGSVPDCDDTPGAILALLKLKKPDDIKKEILAGVNWLLKVQNRDGGFPTFSKGWGKLPFDQSCSDLTGHCFLAIATVLEKYQQKIPGILQKRLKRSLRKALTYLEKNQQNDGSWLPLWFGNQYSENNTSPVYGTARVVCYLKDTLEMLQLEPKLSKSVENLIDFGVQYLVKTQNKDGSWGGAKSIQGTIEETSLAISALTKTKHSQICGRGFTWLDSYFETNGLTNAPIGLYFASLWYDEEMYPLTFYLEALAMQLDT